MNRYFGEEKPSPEEILEHHGVKGMKWGVRKDDSGAGKPYIKQSTESMTSKLKNGKSITLAGDKTPALAKFMSKMSSNFRDRVNASSNFSLKGPDGNTVGEMSLYRESKTSLNVVWVGVDDSERGKGYASAAMRAAVDHARKEKLDTVTLEVPGNSPDARHIYEKMGFKEDPSKSQGWDPVWGGLTAMQLDLNVKHDSLLHYGVKGMRWGVTRTDDELHSNSSSDSYKKAHKAKPQPTPKQAAANLAANEAKSKAKLEPSEAEGKGKARKFVSEHKTAIKTAALGAALAGLIIAGHIHDKRMRESIERHVGKEIDADTFEKHVNFSKSKTWMTNDYMTEHSFDRPEFSLPAGHTFHRLSTADEVGFSRGTYTTHNNDDLNRYISNFRHELSSGDTELKHITFQAKEEIKVPNLRTVLDTLKEEMGNSHFQHSDEQILAKYQSMSGGNWRGGAAEGLFGKLIQKGYGAIVDEMDAGVIGETPLVLFARDLVGEKSSTPLTSDRIAEAESSLIELEHRKY